MHRFFVNRESIITDHVKITGNDAEQIRKVLRIREGEEIAVLDGLGWEYKVKLTEIGVNEIVPLKLERCIVKTPPPPPLLRGGKEGGFGKIDRWQRIEKN